MAAYLNGRLESERDHSPRETNPQDTDDFDYETFGGTYSRKRYPQECQRLSASVTIRPGHRSSASFSRRAA